MFIPANALVILSNGSLTGVPIAEVRIPVARIGLNSELTEVRGGPVSELLSPNDHSLNGTEVRMGWKFKFLLLNVTGVHLGLKSEFLFFLYCGIG
jgi:hypothetical protein